LQDRESLYAADQRAYVDDCDRHERQHMRHEAIDPRPNVDMLFGANLKYFPRRPKVLMKIVPIGETSARAAIRQDRKRIPYL
jgi:hypothetical protein